MKTFSWPVWFPYPSAWLGALTLGFFNLVVGQILKYSVETGIQLAEIFRKPGPLFFCLFLGLLLPFVAISYVHQKIWKPARPPGWSENLPSPASMWAGFYSFNVYCLSSLFTIALFVSFFDSSPSKTAQELEISFYGGIWLVSAAYLYHIEVILRLQSLGHQPQPLISWPTSSAKSKSSTAKKSMRTGVSKQPPKPPHPQTDDEIESMFEELQWQLKKNQK